MVLILLINKLINSNFIPLFFMLDTISLRNKTFTVNNWFATHSGFLRFWSGPCAVQRLPCASLDGMAINRHDGRTGATWLQRATSSARLLSGATCAGDDENRAWKWCVEWLYTRTIFGYLEGLSRAGGCERNPQYTQMDRTDHPSVLEKIKILYLCRNSIHDLSVVVVRNVFWTQ